MIYANQKNMNKEITLSIIIPLYNEEKTIISILEKINKVRISKEIIVINDGSSDNSLKILYQKRLLYDVLISYKENKGKGYACIMGIKKSKGEYIIIQDADLEYNPENYINLLKHINKDTLAVYGSRALTGGTIIIPNGIRPFFSKLANFLLTKLSNVLNGQNLTDAHTCYKLVNSQILKNIDLKEKGFSLCPEITAKLSKKGIVIKEIPIDYFGRGYSEGKKIRAIHAFEAIIALIRYNFPYKRVGK